jgi:hypothetical protein
MAGLMCALGSRSGGWGYLPGMEGEERASAGFLKLLLAVLTESEALR